MSGRCMSSRIRLGRRRRTAARPSRPFIDTLQADLRPAQQHAAHDLDVGLVVLDVVHHAAGGSWPARPATRSSVVRPPSAWGARGSVRMKCEPSPATLCARSEPPISSARRRLMTRPMPVPSTRRAFAAQAVVGLEQLVHLRTCHAQAGVADRDLDGLRLGDAAERTTTLPPSTLYLTALLSRLVRICLTRVSSPSTARARRSSCCSMRRPRCSRRRLDHRQRCADQRAPAPAPPAPACSMPDSMRDRSSVSLIMCSRCQPACWICAAQARWCSASARLAVQAQQLREAEHRVQRRAQLVAHARDELALGAVGSSRPLRARARPRPGAGAR